MIINIIIQSDNISYDTMYNKIGAPIHESLVGNIDYIDSNIVLNLENGEKGPVCKLFVSSDDCQDKEYIREKLKNTIELIMNNI